MSNLLYEDLSYKIIANIEIKAMKKIKNQDEAQLINQLSLNNSIEGAIIQFWRRNVRNVEKNILIIQCNSVKIRGELFNLSYNLFISDSSFSEDVTFLSRRSSIETVVTTL
jgi:hypothetical protein